MIPRLSIGPRTLLKACNHSATAIFWRSAKTNVGRPGSTVRSRPILSSGRLLRHEKPGPLALSCGLSGCHKGCLRMEKDCNPPTSHRSPPLTDDCCFPPPISLEKERGSTRAAKRGCLQAHEPRPALAMFAQPLLESDDAPQEHSVRPSRTPHNHPPPPELVRPSLASPLLTRCWSTDAATCPMPTRGLPHRSRRSSTAAAAEPARARGQARARRTARTARDGTAAGRAWRRGRRATEGPRINPIAHAKGKRFIVGRI